MQAGDAVVVGPRAQRGTLKQSHTQDTFGFIGQLDRAEIRLPVYRDTYTFSRK